MKRRSISKEEKYIQRENETERGVRERKRVREREERMCKKKNRETKGKIKERHCVRMW